MPPNNRENERRVSIKHIVSYSSGQHQSHSFCHRFSTAMSTMAKSMALLAISKIVLRYLYVEQKNTGKSTLGRYVVNRLLSYQYANKSYRARHTRNRGYRTRCLHGYRYRSNRVYPPGFVSIFILDNSEPMLGPALPHWRKPLLSYFIGDVTPRSFLKCTLLQ